MCLSGENPADFFSLILILDNISVISVFIFLVLFFYARLTYCAWFVSVVRTLTGHKSSIRGIDFHPYGEFVASGSLDTNVKVGNLG